MRTGCRAFPTGMGARRLSAEQEAEAAGWIRTGPDLETDKAARRRCVDLQARVADLFGFALHERSVGRSGKAPALPWLRRLRVPRSSALAAPRGGPGGAGVFRSGFSALATAALPEAVRVAGAPIEVWFQDEARVGRQGTLTCVRAERGSRPRAPQDL